MPKQILKAWVIKMRKILVVFFLTTASFNVLNVNAQRCSYHVYNQKSEWDGKPTGEILFYNTCDDIIKIAMAYKVYDSKGNYQYTTAGYSTLSYAKEGYPKRIDLSYRGNGDKLYLIRYVDCEDEDCEKFIKQYKK